MATPGAARWAHKYFSGFITNIFHYESVAAGVPRAADDAHGLLAGGQHGAGGGDEPRGVAGPPHAVCGGRAGARVQLGGRHQARQGDGGPLGPGRHAAGVPGLRRQVTANTNKQ